MEKIIFDQLNNQQVVDIRNQKSFQEGHVKGSLNLNPKNLLKYGREFLEDSEEIVLIVSKEDEADLDELVALTKNEEIEGISNYLIAEELPEEALKTVPTISVADFMSLDKNYQLLDVRHPDEITRPAPEKNLINIPLEKLNEKHAQLIKDEPVYTLCGSGNRATTSASYLKKQGYQPIVIEGGMSTIEEFRD